MSKLHRKQQKCAKAKIKSSLKICVVKKHQGGGVAAPVGGQILSEVLPYLEINQGNPEQIEKEEEIEMPDIVGKTIEEAEKVLKENELNIKIDNEEDNFDKKQTKVKSQIPEPGIKVYKKSCVYINHK